MTTTDTSYHTPDPYRLEGEAASRLADVPRDFLAELLTGAKDVDDPARRDYGDRYTFLGVLGEGGQGVVISAQDNWLRRRVAIKALKAPFEPAQEQQLEGEARICGILEHPNILPTYDLCRDETGSPFLVMKQIEGVSLEDMLHERRKEEAEGKRRGRAQEYSRRRLLSIFLQVCHAMDYAHSRGVYHLDLKPQNVKLGPFGEVYVLDWGFAARDKDEHKYVAGTPIYIAPERLKGSPPNAKSDTYSLGVMLYRILTGRLPRDVGKLSFSEYRERIDDLPIVPPRERDRAVPPDLEAIVMKAMAPDPADRYARVGDLADDLDRFLDILPVSAYREGALGHLWKFFRRHKWMVLSSSAVILAFLTAAGLLWRSHRTEQRAQKLQRMAAEEQQRKRLRARARNPLRKAVTLMELRRSAVEKAKTRGQKIEILASAFDLFEEAIQTDATYGEAHYQRGKAWYLARETGKALADFRRAVDLDPSLIMARYYAGRIYTDKHDHERARREFRLMNEFDPANEYSELGRAFIELAEGRYDAALDRCGRIDTRDLSDVHYIRGFVHQKSPVHRDPALAEADYTRFLERRQDTPSAFLNRGDVRLERGNIDGALDDYRAALSVDPRYKWALNQLGYALYRYRNEPLDGLTYVERAIEEDPDYVWAHMNKGAICDYLKRYDEAERAYERAAALSPEDPDILYRRGLFLFRRRRFGGAEAALTKALAQTLGGAGTANQERRAQAYHRRGIVRLARNLREGRTDHANAVHDFEDSIRLRRQAHVYPALMRWLALTLSKGEPIDHEQFGRQLQAPEDKPWLSALGSLYLGEADEAEVLRLAKTPAALCETHFYLGAFAFANGRTGVAARHFQQALATDFHLYMEYTLAEVFLGQLGGEGKGAVEKEPPRAEGDTAPAPAEARLPNRGESAE